MMIRNTQLAWREIGGETVVIDLNANWMYGLNQPAGRFLREIGELAFTRQLLLEANDSPLDDSLNTAWTDFLDELLECGLLLEVDTDSAQSMEESALAALRQWMAGSPPPQLLWGEEIRNFGQSAGLEPGQGGPCDAT